LGLPIILLLAVPNRLAGLTNHGLCQRRFANVVIGLSFMVAAVCIISILLIVYAMPITMMGRGFMIG
jgi:hypothetical protein